MQWLLLAAGLASLSLAVSIDAAQSKPAQQRGRAQPARQVKQPVIIENTLEAALGQPRVWAQLRSEDGPLTAKPSGDPALRELLGDDRTVERAFLAFLDTGASGHVISKATAERFGIAARENAVYHEVGLHGETQVGVSVPYDLAIAGTSGDTNDHEPPRDDFDMTFEKVAFQLTQSKPAGLMAMMGEINVIGMPAISRMVIEIDPAPMAAVFAKSNKQDPLDALDELATLGNGPAVNILNSKSKKQRQRNSIKDADISIAYEERDFNQRTHPENRGPLPDLARNPIITAIECKTMERRFQGGSGGGGVHTAVGDWLLDTGAAASIISVKTAQSLGLYDNNREPAVPADFTLPLGGVGGEVKPANGYIIDSITIKAAQGKSLEFKNARVVVQDVGVKLGEREVILDGVLGMNLLLPSGADFSTGLPAKTNQGPFEKIWIDGPCSALALKLRR